MSQEITKNLFESVARAVAQAYVSGKQKTTDYRGIQVIIEVSAVTSTPSVVPKIQGMNENTGNWYPILTGAAITATGTVVLRVHPDIEAVSNLAASSGLPNIWRVIMTHGDTDSITYSVDYNGTT